MSFPYLIVTPLDPLLVPDLETRESTLALLLSLRPTESWRMDVFDAPHVYVGPDSFEGAACPRCRTKPSIFVGGGFECAVCPNCEAHLRDWWFDEMDHWWAREDRRDLAATTSCCAFETSLDELTRRLPISFACFAIGLECADGELQARELEQVSAALGAPARSFCTS